MTITTRRERHVDFSELFQSVEIDLIISSPYISNLGAEFLSKNLSPNFKLAGRLRFLTDLSPRNIYQGATNPNSFKILFDSISKIQIFHLPRLHAKVYISDNRSAMITSGNLTAGGIFHNFEYGVNLTERAQVSLIKNDLLGFAGLGAKIDAAQIDRYCEISKEISKSYREKEGSVKREADLRFREAINDANEQLIRATLSGGPLHTVFQRTILYLLRKYGPLPTARIHILIDEIHPDLCDNSVDRVIDGIHFGKKWKHAVRTAQQHLKSSGFIRLADGLWALN